MMEECESFDLALNLFRSRRVPSEGKLAPTPVGRLLPMRWRMAAIKTVKRVGAIMQPCLTPVTTLKGSVSEPLQRTAADMLSWRSLWLRHAFVRSMKAIYSDWPCECLVVKVKLCHGQDGSHTVLQGGSPLIEGGISYK